MSFFDWDFIIAILLIILINSGFSLFYQFETGPLHWIGLIGPFTAGAVCVWAGMWLWRKSNGR